MRYSVLVSTVLASVALAAPSWDIEPEDMPLLSDYFRLLGQKVQAQKALSDEPVCDLTKASLLSSSLPSPADNLYLAHVAIGRGTQNYTCPGNNDTAPPTAVGAVATLYNASCIASLYPDVLAMLPNITLALPVPEPGAVLAPASLSWSGHHFFTNNTTPYFNLNSNSMSLGEGPCGKNASAPAPAPTTPGQHGKGNGTVPWLQLLTKDGATDDLAQVYRINTAGGAAPATCAGMPTAFTVQYAAEYWFYKSH